MSPLDFDKFTIFLELCQIFLFLHHQQFHYDLEEMIGKKLTARPRFSSKGLAGKLKLLKSEESNENRIIFEFDEKTHENSEGQHIVFYLDNKIVGGGEIKVFDKV